MAQRSIWTLVALASLPAVGCSAHRASSVPSPGIGENAQSPGVPVEYQRVEQARLPLSEQDRRDLLALAVRARPSERIEKIVIDTLGHPGDIPAAQIKYHPIKTGPRRYRRCSVRVFHQDWTALRGGSLHCPQNEDTLSRGRWCTSMEHIYLVDTYEYDWRGENVTIKFSGELTYAELDTLLKRIEKRDYEVDDPVAAPIIDVPAVNFIDRHVAGEVVVYEVTYGGSYTAWGVAVFQLRGETLKLDKYHRAISTSLRQGGGLLRL